MAVAAVDVRAALEGRWRGHEVALFGRPRFEGVSTTHAAFPGHAVQPAPASPPPPARAHRPFEGTSSYADAFHAHPAQPAPRSPQPPPRAPVPFEGGLGGAARAGSSCC